LPEGQDEGAFLREKVLDGLRRRFGDPVPAAAVERMEMELAVIGKMGFDAYFLIVWDFVKWAKDNGIAVGPGRGSAAGSLVAYALRITDLDPLHHGLLFERFLNPERVSMPDIDIDFSVKGRDRVMKYVAEKYGRESVAQIITFGKMLPRAATKDAARVLGHDYGVGTGSPSSSRTPSRAARRSSPTASRRARICARSYDADPTAKQVIDVAAVSRGSSRNNSIHAAAVVIAGMPLTTSCRCSSPTPARSMRTATSLQDGHAVLDEADRDARAAEDGLPRAAQPRRHRGGAGHHRALQRRAARTWTRCRWTTRGPTRCSPRATRSASSSSSRRGMQGRLRQVKPTEFDDLVALVALYRPGAMDQIPTYARGKKNPDNVEVPDPRLDPSSAAPTA
jgi:DNA polymerase-3 subunit alpha